MNWGEGARDFSQWESPEWRLSNLYFILDDQGQKVRFVPNEVQRDFFANLWYLNIILKARQEGFTTFVDLLILDQCVWRPDLAAGIIAHTMSDAQSIFSRKIQYPYKSLPEGLRAKVGLVKDTQSDFRLSNGSSIAVSTSFRSGTLQMLHISEFGKIAAKYPSKAVEIVTGSFNTIAPGQWIFVESTAEGKSGVFYNMVQAARQQQDEGRPLTQLDFKFHFYAWWRKATNVLPPESVEITKEMAKYFAEIEQKMGIVLDPAQRAWYVRKREQMVLAGGKGTIDGDALMKREHPSTPDEAFEAAVEGAYFTREMQAMRKEGRIVRIPYTGGVPVQTYWDLGRKDRMVIIAHQKVRTENRIINFYENSGYDVDHYAKVLQDWSNEYGYVYGRHWLPHDARNKTIGAPKSPQELLEDLGVRPTEIVERVELLDTGIQQTRQMFPSLLIDSERCADLVIHMDMYRKAWNETVGDWYNHPVEDEHVHAVDALRQMAQSGAWSKSDLPRPQKKQAARSWRSV